MWLMELRCIIHEKHIPDPKDLVKREKGMQNSSSVFKYWPHVELLIFLDIEISEMYF